MSVDYKLVQLFKGIKALKDIPIAQLKENKGLLQEIQDVVNSKFIQGIVSDLRNEQLSTQNIALQDSNKSFLKVEDLTFLTKFSRFKNGMHDRISKGRPVAYTKILSMAEAVAGRKDFAEAKNVSTRFKEAKEFKEAYNSIFSDRSLQIGTDQDPTIIQSYIDFSPYINNYQYYLAIPTLSQTIDKGIQIATRELPEIITDDKNLTDELYKYIKRYNVNSKIQRLLFYSHLSPRGSVLVPIEENGKVRFNVFNDTQFTYSVSPNYNKIDFYDTGNSVANIYVLGYNLQNGVTCHFLCPGFEPIYGVGKNRIYQLKGAAEAINIYLYTIKVLCIRAQVLVQKWNGEGQSDTLLAELQKLSQDIDSKLSLSTALKMPDNAELEILNNNINEGFSKVSPIIKEYMGMLAGIMPDYFFGSDTAYSANSFNIQVTHQNIRSDIQEPQIEPAYRYIINTLLRSDSRFAKWKNLEDDFEIKFPSLYEPTEVEKADIDTKRIDNLIKMADYPELQDIFKKEGLLDSMYKMEAKGDIDEET